MESEAKLLLAGIFGFVRAIFRPVGFALYALLFGRDRARRTVDEARLVLTGGFVIGIFVGVGIGIGDGSSVFEDITTTEDVLTWIAALILAPIGGLIIAAVVNGERKRQEAVEADRRAAELKRERRHAEAQAALNETLRGLGNQALSSFEMMPTYLTQAEDYLDSAESDFAERAFAPFWDCIEKTAKELGRFDEAVRKIESHASQYSALLEKCETAPPPFPLARTSLVKLIVGSSSATRMATVVRTAQRDFQFATIYEQRKTNQILVAGFTSLAQALDRMTSQITMSIDDLTTSVDNMNDAVSRSLHAVRSSVAGLAEQSRNEHGEAMSLAKEAAARETKALEMLDNIQRRRRPA